MTVAGEVLEFAAETDAVVANIDHFWIAISAGVFGRVEISISTLSRLNRNAGFDAHVRLAIIPSRWETLPAAGVRPRAPFDYHQLATHPSYEFSEYEREMLERLLLVKTARAIFVEAWGELYLRKQIGIHQVHSRRASCSVPRDFAGRDGALRFYFAEDQLTETWLFKFCGQV